MRVGSVSVLGVFRFPEFEISCALVISKKKKRLPVTGKPFLKICNRGQAAVPACLPESIKRPQPGLPGALLMTIGLQTLAAFVLIHLETALFLEVTHM
jgi:hypothetical protein